MDNTRDITADTLQDAVRELREQGNRLVTLTCLDADEDHLEILYHFDKDLELTNLRLAVPRGPDGPGAVPSISGIFAAAMLVENEIRDQFGLCFDGLALDFGGGLYLEEEVRVSPFCKYSVAKKEA